MRNKLITLKNIRNKLIPLKNKGIKIKNNLKLIETA
jgi:hypothetical protein